MALGDGVTDGSVCLFQPVAGRLLVDRWRLLTMSLIYWRVQTTSHISIVINGSLQELHPCLTRSVLQLEPEQIRRTIHKVKDDGAKVFFDPDSCQEQSPIRDIPTLPGPEQKSSCDYVRQGSFTR